MYIYIYIFIYIWTYIYFIYNSYGERTPDFVASCYLQSWSKYFRQSVVFCVN